MTSKIAPKISPLLHPWEKVLFGGWNSTCDQEGSVRVLCRAGSAGSKLGPPLRRRQRRSLCLLRAGKREREGRLGLPAAGAVLTACRKMYKFWLAVFEAAASLPRGDGGRTVRLDAPPPYPDSSTICSEYKFGQQGSVYRVTQKKPENLLLTQIWDVTSSCLGK